jgi:hypothetical protein
MKEMMNTTAKRSTKSLILSGILILSLSGCVAGNPFIVTEDKLTKGTSQVDGQYVKEQALHYSIDDLNTSLLRYSTTGLILVNGEKYSISKFSKQSNPAYEQTGIDITIRESMRPGNVESLAISYAPEKGLPTFELLPEEKYISAEPSQVVKTGDIEIIKFPIEVKQTLNQDILTSLQTSWERQTKQPVDTAGYNVEVTPDGKINIFGPEVPGVTDETTGNVYTIDPAYGVSSNSSQDKDREPMSSIFYGFTDGDKSLAIEATLIMAPYYNTYEGKLVVEWNISKPIPNPNPQN